VKQLDNEQDEKKERNAMPKRRKESGKTLAITTGPSTTHLSENGGKRGLNKMRRALNSKLKYEKKCALNKNGIHPRVKANKQNRVTHERTITGRDSNNSGARGQPSKLELGEMDITASRKRKNKPRDKGRLNTRASYKNDLSGTTSAGPGRAQSTATTVARENFAVGEVEKSSGKSEARRALRGCL